MNGEILKQLRRSKNLTQKQLGELVGVTDSAIRLFETNKRSPSYTTLKNLAEVLEVTIEYLETGEENGNLQANNVVIKIIDRLIETGVITDSNNIDKDIEDMIMFAVRSEIEKRLNKKD
jgi:transcriptional regulator with XRE-family HTH domain